MAFLREAVEKQKAYLIEQLVASGVVDNERNDLYQKPISEIVSDYEQFCLDIERNSQNRLKFTRYQPRQEEKPRLH
ncbi:hypothetical protein J416_15207 [Gracilibacillus halophilus YIM-C55.5]|uniref:Fur-regulated basic protein FbpA n=1 Tax=Gracilibacillus halophilus YIM-C55.5 TaxID=1308866 RepID=N4W5Z0_9BACI|nr:Fur-regulated basic protein FbpA [Gracilibacillus halophilus]ENH95613.1 hypothetical protein J416_15207 [Gracilibacillus halophilus YIM-C55.5]